MDWHVHLFVHDNHEEISRFMNSLHGEYAQYFNKTIKRVGHVFGERYNNKIVQANPYGLWLSRYIHRQAVAARLVKDPKNYPWTSYRAYIGLQPLNFLQPGVIWEQFGSTKDRKSKVLIFRRYADFIIDGDDGPVDWGKKTTPIIGDHTFIKRIATRIDKETEMGTSAKPSFKGDLQDLLKAISAQYDIDMKRLVNPTNKDDRQLRRQVYDILINEYHLSLRTIGRLFHISAPAVYKAVGKQSFT